MPRIEELHGIKRFWYAKFLGEADGMPIVLEAALAEVEEEGVQTPYFGLNFSLHIRGSVRRYAN